MKIIVIGVGALGSNLVASLVPDLKGSASIAILDHDNVQERNTQPGTQFYTPDQIGISKVGALQYNIFKNFEREIDIFYQKIDDFSDTVVLNDYDMVIDCLDNFSGRDILHTYYRSAMVIDREMLHLGFSKEFTFAIEWASNYKVPTDIKGKFDICEMTGASSFVKMVASLGSSVIQEYIRSKKQMSFVGNRFSITNMATGMYSAPPDLHHSGLITY